MRKVRPLNKVNAGMHRSLVRVLATTLGAVFLSCAGSRAIAAIIPEGPTPAHIVAVLSFNLFPPNPIEVITFGEHQLFGPGGRMRLDSELFPSPFLHAAVVDIRDGFFGRVSAALDYEVMVVGPETNFPIPVFAAVSGEVQGNALPGFLPLDPGGSFALKANWSISDAISGAVIDEGGIVTPQRSGAFFDSFADLVILNLTANRRFKVRLVADAGIANGVTNGGIGSARAFVDPVFSFAPGVGPEYSFVFSEGVGNLPIPEPEAYLLLSAGLLVVFALSRGKTRGI